MKKIAFLLVLIALASCGRKVAFTDQIRDEYNLNEQNLKKVQFYTSNNIILSKSKTSGSQSTGDDGSLVSSKNNHQERIIIYPNTKCVYEGKGPNGEMLIRFEVGNGNFLKFAIRQQMASGKYYLVADWKGEKGGELNYANQIYYADQNSSVAYLKVKLKSLNKTKRKDRKVKGMKV